MTTLPIKILSLSGWWGDSFNKVSATAGGDSPPSDSSSSTSESGESDDVDMASPRVEGDLTYRADSIKEL